VNILKVRENKNQIIGKQRPLFSRAYSSRDKFLLQWSFCLPLLFEVVII